MSKLQITWRKSAIRYPKDQADTIRSLGLKHLNQTVEQPDTPVVRGMVQKVRHLVRIAEVVEVPAPPQRRARRRLAPPPQEPAAGTS